MHIHIEEGQEPIDGFLDSFTSDGRVNVKVFLALTSDSPEFYKCMEQISKVYFSSTQFSMNVNGIHGFLILVHRDLSADIYINDFLVATQVRFKRSSKSFEVGTLIRHSDIADICGLSFPDIEIQDSDSVVCCLKVGWKFLLYFDSRGRHGEKVDVGLILTQLGRLYRYLSFQDVYLTLESETHFKEMVSDGWFPFVEILGNDYKSLAATYENGKPTSNREVKALLDKFDESRIKGMTSKWWENRIFEEKRELLQAGIDAFLRGTKPDYINCIKNLYTEIEGIMRSVYFEDSGKGTRSFEKLINHLIAVGEKTADDDHSLLLPQYFLKYLTEGIFKEFDPETGAVDLSRHTATHGVADGKNYTAEKALQALLTLDQIYFYLPSYSSETETDGEISKCD